MPTKQAQRPDEDQEHEPLFGAPGQESAQGDGKQKVYDSKFDDMLNSGVMGKDPEAKGIKAGLAGKEQAGGSGSSGNIPGSEAGLLGGLKDQIGKGEKGGAGSRLKAGVNIVTGIITRNPKKVLGGTGAIGGSLGLVFAIYSVLAPQVINTYLTNIEAKYMAAAKDGVADQADNMLNHYIVKHVIPGLRAGFCTDTKGTTKECVAPVSGNSPINKLMDSWRQQRIEGKLADKYGIEFGKDGLDRIYMKAPHMATVNLSDLESGKKASIWDYDQVSRKEIRYAIREALASETRWKRTMLRFQIGRLLEEKYGVRRCVWRCDKKDERADKAASRKAAAYAYFVERIVEPRSTLLAQALTCLMDPKCEPEKTDQDPDNPDDATNGQKVSQTEKEMRSVLEQGAQKLGTKSLDELAKVIDDINKEGATFSSYFITKTLGKFIGKEVSAKALDKVFGPVGFANTAFQIVEALKTAGPKYQKLSYVINSTTAVQFYQMFKTIGAEQKAGHSDPIVFGSFVDWLGPGSKPDGTGAGGTSSRMYNAMSGTTPKVTSADVPILNQLNGTAYAAAAVRDPEKFLETCDDGQPPPKGEIKCEEEVLVGNNKYLTAISTSLTSGPLAIVGLLASAWNSSAGTVLGWFSDAGGAIISHIPGVKSVGEFIAKAAMPLFTLIVEKLFPTWIQLGMDGARAVKAFFAGGQVLGGAVGRNIGGGMVLSPNVFDKFVYESEKEERYAFERQPLSNRLFDTENRFSLAANVALALPTDGRVAAQALLSSPFAIMSDTLNTLFTNKAGAILPRTIIAFPESPMYGWDSSHPITQETMNGDPDATWAKYKCDTGEYTRQWNNAGGGQPVDMSQLPGLPAPTGRFNDENGTYDHTSPNPCILLRTTVGALGGYTNSELLKPDDLGLSGTPTVAGGPGNPVTGDAKKLAQLILDHPNIDFQVKPEQEDWMKAIAATGRATGCGGTAVDPIILGTVLATAQQYKMVIGVLVNGHSCNDGYHPKGQAVDINGVSKLDGTVTTGNRLHFNELSREQMLLVRDFYDDFANNFPADVGGMGQIQCFPSYAQPTRVSGVEYFNDPCDHIHADSRD